MGRIKYTKDRKEWPLTSKYGYSYYHIFGIDDSGPYGTVKGYYFDDYMYSDKSDLTHSKITEFVNKYPDVDRVLIRVYEYNALMDGPGASEESIYWRGKASEFRNSNSKKEAIEENDKMIKEDFKQSVGEDLYKYVSENYYKMEREELKTIAVEAIYQLYDRIPERDYKDAIELILEVYSDTYGEEFEGDIAEKLTNEYMGMTREELRLFAVEALYQLSSYLSEEEYKEAHDDIYDIYSEYFGNGTVEESTKGYKIKAGREGASKVFFIVDKEGNEVKKDGRTVFFYTDKEAKEYMKSLKESTRVENAINRLTEKEVLQLRSEIVLDSSYLSDYENTLGIDAEDVYNFFDGYVSYIVELAEENGMPNDSYDIADVYDNEENLLTWWYMQMGDENYGEELHNESVIEEFKLVDKNGNEIEIHEEVTDFRGDKAVVTGIYPPHKESSSGHVEVDYGNGDVRFLYATVFGLKYVKQDTVEESLITERRWEYEEPLGKELRDYIEQEDYENILKTIYNIAKKYEEKLGDDGYEFEELAYLVENEWELVDDYERLSEIDFDSPEDLVDERLEMLYDACDSNGIFLSL